MTGHRNKEYLAITRRMNVVYNECIRKYGIPPPILGITLKEKEVLREYHKRGFRFKGVDIVVYS